MTGDGQDMASGRPVAIGPKPRPVADPLDYSMLKPLAGIRSLLRAMGHRAEEGWAGDAELRAMVELRDLLALAIDITVLAELEAGQSFGDIAKTLGITRQSVAARYRGMSCRNPGGQPSHQR